MTPCGSSTATARYLAPRTNRLMAGGGEVHVVLGVAGPGPAPAPAGGAEAGDRPRRHHPLEVARAVAVGPERRVPALPASDIRVLPRVDRDGQPVRVHRPAAGALAARAWRGHRLAALEGRGHVAVLRPAPRRAVKIGDLHVPDRE